MFLPGIGALQLVPILPKPSPMLVLHGFLPSIGALPKTRYMSSILAASGGAVPSLPSKTSNTQPHVSPGYLSARHWGFPRQASCDSQGCVRNYHENLCNDAAWASYDNGRPPFVLLISLSSNCEAQRTIPENCSKM